MTDNLVKDVEHLARTTAGREQFLLETARSINRHCPHYTWVVFYFLKGGKLHVGPYVGKPTPHTVIDLNRGVCGAAVSQGETIVVADVQADPRYLACSLETRSEIVIPLRIGDRIIGELDIDSDRKAAFDDNDRRFLEQLAEKIARKLEEFP